MNNADFHRFKLHHQVSVKGRANKTADFDSWGVPMHYGEIWYECAEGCSFGHHPTAIPTLPPQHPPTNEQ